MSWVRRDTNGHPSVVFACHCDGCNREAPETPNKADAMPGWADYFVDGDSVDNRHYCPRCEPKVRAFLDSLKPKQEGAQA